MPTWVRSEFQAEAQDYINGRQVASNYYQRSTLLSAMRAMSLGNQDKKSLEIGRPNGAIILGQNINPLESLTLGTINTYNPRIQLFKTNNTRYRKAFDDSPSVANRDTNAHSSATLATAGFRWCAPDCPVWVWHEHLDRALTSQSGDGQGIAVQTVLHDANEVAYQDINDRLIQDIWTGNPTDQTEMLWDAPLGVFQALSTNNTYGMVDRTDSLAANWRSQVDSTLKAVDIKRIANDARYTKKLNTLGSAQPTYLILTNANLFLTFKDQIQAARLQTIDVSKSIPEMARAGVKYEIQQFEDCLVGYEPYLDNTGYENYVVVLDLSTWKFMVHPKYNWRVTPFEDQSKIYQGPYADYAQINLRYMFTCDNPYRNVLYSAIGT